MTWYSIYKNMTREEFETIKARLTRLEDICTPFMQLHKFHKNDRYSDESLNINYSFQNSDFAGSIGIIYDEDESTKGVRLFRISVIKTFDTPEYRFFKKGGISQLQQLEDLEVNLVPLLEKCIFIFQSFKKTDLIDKIKLKE